MKKDNNFCRSYIKNSTNHKLIIAMTKNRYNRRLVTRIVLLAAASSVMLVLLFHIQNSCHVATTTNHYYNLSELEVLSDRLRRAVTFLPLKDLRYSYAALDGHTWFMSSLLDHQDSNGGVQFQLFPSASLDGRVLCLKGRDRHDGTRNSYALAWPESLPYNATLAKGLTFVSYNHYDYNNIWHGLSALVPFVAWHLQGRCRAGPDRWVLYHQGEVRVEMSVWLRTLIEATFGGGAPTIEVFEAPAPPESVVCLEEAVVMRHNEGGMSRERRMEVYDLMRCKARSFCKVSSDDGGEGFNSGVKKIGMTILMRTGPRSFRNGTAVVRVFESVCAEIEGCRLRLAYSSNLTFCQQVKLMSMTDVLISPHGAQLTNMFLMDRNSSVMEFFPKGWLKLAGVGQYVYHWIASWSGMRHRGAWRDPQDDGPPCPYPEDDRRCMSFFKSARIGHNETYFSEWARNVISEVKIRKNEEAISKLGSLSARCSCK